MKTNLSEGSYHFGKLKPGVWYIYQIQKGKKVSLFLGSYPSVSSIWQSEFKNQHVNLNKHYHENTTTAIS